MCRKPTSTEIDVPARHRQHRAGTPRWDPTTSIGAYAGLRPLIDTGEGRTADVSREHAVVESPSGVISVIGGKLTEYRHMAEDVLDRAVALRGLTAGPLPDPQPAAGRRSGEPGGDAAVTRPICRRHWWRGTAPRRRT